MWFMTVLSWIALVMQIAFFTVGLAAGLYYVAELVEEYTVIAKRVITYMVVVTISRPFLILYFLLMWSTDVSVLPMGSAATGSFLFLWLFEEFPSLMMWCGLAANVAHFIIMMDFPYVNVLGPAFIVTVIMFFVNHYLAFSYFATHHYTLGEAMGYFTICLWMVPFALFVSLSANENVLPTLAEEKRHHDDDSVLGSYLSQRGKKVGLCISLLNSVNSYVLPQRNKKLF